MITLKEIRVYLMLTKKWSAIAVIIVDIDENSV